MADLFTPDPWWKGTICAFDLETTGLDLEKDRIVQIAAVFYAAGAIAVVVGCCIMAGL